MVPKELGIWSLRIMLIFWLSFLPKEHDALYGVLMSIRKFDECRRLVIGNVS